jgi:hypothetical protein
MLRVDPGLAAAEPRRSPLRFKFLQSSQHRFSSVRSVSVPFPSFPE